MSSKHLTISCFLLAVMLFIISCSAPPSAENTSLPTDAVTIAKGEALFTSHCSTCHNFYHVGTGPRLAGITSDTSVAWIRHFIADPKKVIESGDDRAVKLFKKYKTTMPAFGHLPEEDIMAILAFMHTRKKEAKSV